MLETHRRDIAPRSNIIIFEKPSPCPFLYGFDVTSMENPSDGSNGERILHYGGKYLDYSMKITVKNGKKEGKGVIRRKDKTPYMALEFVHDVPEGEIIQYNEYEKKTLRGHLAKGKETGLFIEYDGNDQIVWTGLYRDGKRYLRLTETTRGSSIYEEKSPSGAITSVSHYDPLSLQKDGLSYEYENGSIACVWEYQQGNQNRLLKEIKGDSMIEYDKEGNKVYEGGYSGDPESGLVREGKGTEYDGETVAYEGEWRNGKRYDPALEKKSSKGGKTKRLGRMILPLQGDGKRKHILLWGVVGVAVLLITIVVIAIVLATRENVTSFQSCEELQSVSSKKAEAVTSLKLMKGVECKEVDLSRFVNCERIIVDEDAMTTVTRVFLTKLYSLKSLFVGDRSCGSLKYLDVGKGAFEQLTSIVIGSNAMNGIQSIPSNLLAHLETVEIGSLSLNALLSVDISTLASLQSLSIGTFSLNQLASFPVSVMKSLRSLQIGSSSIMAVTQLALGGMDLLENTWIDEGCLSGVTTVQVGDTSSTALEAFGLFSDGAFSISRNFKLKNARTLVILNDCLCGFNQFDLNGVGTVETVVVGAGSFCGSETGSFSVRNCPDLRTITIESGSFSSFGSAQFHNLTSLETVSLRSSSFQHAASLNLTDSTIRKLEIGDHCFEETKELQLTDLSALESITIGSSFGASDLDQGAGLCRIHNCSRLQSVSVASHSFEDYATLEIHDNPLLNAIQIGSWCFASAQSITLEGSSRFHYPRRSSQAHHAVSRRIRLPWRQHGESDGSRRVPLQFPKHARAEECVMCLLHQ